jgi:hypothetical protein
VATTAVAPLIDIGNLEADNPPDMDRVFGQRYPTNGMLLAMRIHSLHQDTWLINGVVRQDDISPPCSERTQPSRPLRAAREGQREGLGGEIGG